MPHTQHNVAQRDTQNAASNRVGKRLARFGLLVSIVVIALGAFTRLTDAGLGCPDWPGCYGQLIVPQHPTHTSEANSLYPMRPLEHAKAWAEMIHRYVAGTLAVLIFSLCALHIKHRTAQRTLTTCLAISVIGQAALGMWTVTLGLKPIIVTAHLLGGFTTFSLLFALTLRQSTVMARLTSSQLPGTPVSRSLLTMAFLALVLQITLGSWTAANYAATVCTTLPICHGNWIEHLNFTAALKLWGHDVSPYTQGGTSAYEYAQHLSLDTKITIHVLHRFGAVFASTLILLCAGHLWRRSPHLASGLILLLILQVGLGITNILALLPLSIALLHNLVAALLLGWMLLSVLWTYQQPCLAKHVSLDSRNVQTRPLPTSTHKTTA